MVFIRGDSKREHDNSDRQIKQSADPLTAKNREQNEMVARFEAHGVYWLEDPISYETKYSHGRRRMALGDLRTADTTDDIL